MSTKKQNSTSSPSSKTIKNAIALPRDPYLEKLVVHMAENYGVTKTTLIHHILIDFKELFLRYKNSFTEEDYVLVRSTKFADMADHLMVRTEAVIPPFDVNVSKAEYERMKAERGRLPSMQFNVSPLQMEAINEFMENSEFLEACVSRADVLQYIVARYAFSHGIIDFIPHFWLLDSQLVGSSRFAKGDAFELPQVSPRARDAMINNKVVTIHAPLPAPIIQYINLLCSIHNVGFEKMLSFAILREVSCLDVKEVARRSDGGHLSFNPINRKVNVYKLDEENVTYVEGAPYDAVMSCPLMRDEQGNPIIEGVEHMSYEKFYKRGMGFKVEISLLMMQQYVLKVDMSDLRNPVMICNKVFGKGAGHSPELMRQIDDASGITDTQDSKPFTLSFPTLPPLPLTEDDMNFIEMNKMSRDMKHWSTIVSKLKKAVVKVLDTRSEEELRAFDYNALVDYLYVRHTEIATRIPESSKETLYRHVSQFIKFRLQRESVMKKKVGEGKAEVFDL